MARSRIEIEGDALEHQSDADLAARAASGDKEAFEELYRRHSRTAMRVAYRVTGNIHDASDAVSDAFARVMLALPKGALVDPARFRAYLMTATRHSAVDVLRRAGRSIPSEEAPEPVETVGGPHEKLIDAADSSLVAAAFRALPERWRSVLWLTEVEGIPAREAAGLLDMSPNGVAQLAVRARAGLRDRYLQAHLREADGECRDAVRSMGAYVGGGLAARDIARVDQHLAGCDPCKDRQDDLREIGTTLRRAVMPVPVAGGVGRWLWNLAERLWRSGSDAVAPSAEALATKVVPAGVAAVALFVAGLGGVVLHNTPKAAPPAHVAAAPIVKAPVGAVAGTSAAAAAAAPAAAVSETVASPVATAAPSGEAESAAPVVESDAPAGSDSPVTPTTPTTVPPASSADDPPASHDDPEPIVQLPDLDAPVTVPTIPPLVDEVVPELPGTLPTIPELIEDLPLVDDLPLIQEFQLGSLFGAADAGIWALVYTWIDEPLPSPSGPGLPV